jgi:hypothetical protein
MPIATLHTAHVPRALAGPICINGARSGSRLTFYHQRIDLSALWKCVSRSYKNKINRVLKGDASDRAHRSL